MARSSVVRGLLHMGCGTLTYCIDLLHDVARYIEMGTLHAECTVNVIFPSLFPFAWVHEPGLTYTQGRHDVIRVCLMLGSLG